MAKSTIIPFSAPEMEALALITGAAITFFQENGMGGSPELDIVIEKISKAFHEMELCKNPLCQFKGHKRELN